MNSAPRLNPRTRWASRVSTRLSFTRCVIMAWNHSWFRQGHWKSA